MQPICCPPDVTDYDYHHFWLLAMLSGARGRWSPTTSGWHNGYPCLVNQVLTYFVMQLIAQWIDQQFGFLAYFFPTKFLVSVIREILGKIFFPIAQQEESLAPSCHHPRQLVNVTATYLALYLPLLNTLINEEDISRISIGLLINNSRLARVLIGFNTEQHSVNSFSLDWSSKRESPRCNIVAHTEELFPLLLLHIVQLKMRGMFREAWLL